MKVHELISNPEFSFNVRFQIQRYSPTEKDIDRVIVLYDSEMKQAPKHDILMMNISAINQSDDGFIEIECY